MTVKIDREEKDNIAVVVKDTIYLVEEFRPKCHWTSYSSSCYSLLSQGVSAKERVRHSGF